MSDIKHTCIVQIPSPMMRKIRIATFLPLSAPIPMNTLSTLQSNKNKGPPYIELNYHL